MTARIKALLAMAGWLCMSGMCSGALRAAEEFRLFTETFVGAEGDELTRYVLLTQDRRFSFLAPPGWSVSADRGKKTVRILPPDLKAGIVLRFAEEEEGGRVELERERIRDQIQTRYPGVRFRQEFECATAGRIGMVFDVERLVEGRIRAAMRLAFVPYDGGVAEFELTTAAERLEEYHVPLGRLLNSFRVSTRSMED